MKILHISYSHTKGGASRAALRIHNSLLKKKIKSFLQIKIFDKNVRYEKNIIKPNKYYSYLNKIKSAIESKISHFLRFDDFAKNSISLFPSNLSKEINQSNYDIVHLHWVNGETISIEDIGLIKKPIVWTLHDMWPFSGSEHYTFNKYWKIGYKKKKIFYNFNISKLTWKRKYKSWRNLNLFIVGVSNWISNSAAESLLFKKFPIQTIHNTLDTNFWRPEHKEKCRRYFNLPQDVKVIGFGSLGYKNTNLKGKDIFVSAIKKLSYDKKKVILFTIGDSNQFSKHINGIKLYSIPRLEIDDEIKKFYNSLDVIVIPSRFESFGQTASEALSCGVPVVCFDVTGLKDIVFHKLNGWLAKPYQATSLAKGVKYFLELSNKNYSSICKYSRNQALKKFSYDTISKKYIYLYKLIIENHR